MSSEIPTKTSCWGSWDEYNSNSWNVQQTDNINSWNVQRTDTINRWNKDVRQTKTSLIEKVPQQLNEHITGGEMEEVGKVGAYGRVLIREGENSSKTEICYSKFRRISPDFQKVTLSGWIYMVSNAMNNFSDAFAEAGNMEQTTNVFIESYNNIPDLL
ncbi:12750_t:CDS:2 [Funneliformis geosporum]|uniref:12750_t:CDS:1 n=1 Tax=Funneliformis geosporum TaxID=1117311 RepID=A0A9W4WVX7_9GLOM|nr:12750_t:CDS:2 [Funneliformis geosporum]